MILLSIDNLSNEVNEQEIERLFSCYGEVRSIKLALNAPHSRFPGSGLIEMESKDAQSVITELDGHLFWGLALRVIEVRSSEKITTLPPETPMEPTQSSTDTTGNYLRRFFRVVSVQKVTDPELGPAQDWYRYTLMGGNSRITGLHRGTMAEVTEFAENSAQAFNLRNSSKGSKSIIWSSRNKK